MLWTEVLRDYAGGDVEVIYTDGRHIRGPLPEDGGMRFEQNRFRFAFNPAWCKILVGKHWIDCTATTIEFDTTLTGIRHPGDDKIRIDLMVVRAATPPKKGFVPFKVAEINVYPATQAIKWRAQFEVAALT